MSRRQPVSADEVYLACNRLVARGERPSHRLVRLEVGGGSLSTIAEHLHAWQAEQAKAPNSLGPATESIRALEALSPTAAAAVRDSFRAEVATELKVARSETDFARTRAQDLQDALVMSEREKESLVERSQVLEEKFNGLSQAILAIEHGALSMLKTIIDQIDRLTKESIKKIEDHNISIEKSTIIIFQQLEEKSSRIEKIQNDILSSSIKQTLSITELISHISSTQSSLQNRINHNENNFKSLRMNQNHLASVFKKSILEVANTNEHQRTTQIKRGIKKKIFASAFTK